MAIIDVLQVISVAFCYLLPHCFLKNIFSEFVSSFLLQQWTYGKRVEKVSCQTFYVDESLSYMLILNRCRLQCFKILSKCYCGFCGRDPNTVWILILASFAFVLWLFPSLTCLQISAVEPIYYQKRFMRMFRDIFNPNRRNRRTKQERTLSVTTVCFS